MALLDRLQRKHEPETETKAAGDESLGRVAARNNTGNEYQELKSRVHNRLFDLLDLTRMSKVSEERTRSDVEAATKRILGEENVLLTLEDQAQLVREIQDEVFGLGPLEPLLADPTVTDILVNGHSQIYVERRGKIEPTVARFKDDAHLMRIIEKIVSAVGRRIDETSPMVDARLADGSRVNVIVPPLALDGPSMSIRRFGSQPLRAEDLIDEGSVTPEIFELLRGVINARLNVLISGGTGSGKTTMLRVVCLPQGIRRAATAITATARPPRIQPRRLVVWFEPVSRNLRRAARTSEAVCVRDSTSFSSNCDTMRCSSSSTRGLARAIGAAS